MKSKKINVLLVDDSEKFLKSVAERTKLKGFNVFTASSGKQALDIAQKQPIHVAVVDQRMPDMEGLVVITKLKGFIPDIQTILLTGHGDEKLKEASEALNSTYFDKQDMGRFWAFCRICRWAISTFFWWTTTRNSLIHWQSGYS